MRLLFASSFPHDPDSISGRDVSVDALARNLCRRGIPVAAFAALPTRRLAEQSGAPFLCNRDLGYPVYRAARTLEGYAAALADWRPQVAILPLSPQSAPMAALGLAAGVKVAFHATSGYLRDLATPVVAQPGVGLIANSAWTARRLQALLGAAPPVLPPLIEPERYRVESRGDAVLMINPTAQKGVEIFLRLAEARPEIPFLAVESWAVGDDWRTVLLNRARGLGNVALWSPVDDMCEAYARARLLLAPSVYEETFCRVVAEAQVSGIPALVSDRGALPETVGNGGTVVPLDAGIDAWTAALDGLWQDPARFAACAAAARAESARPERDPERIIDRLLEVLQGL